MKIFFFGGAFDPPHLGHYEIVLNCLKHADKFIIIPNKISTNENKILIDANHRINMLNLMFKDKKIEIDTFEIDSNKENYTIYTAEYLLKKYRNSRLTMVLGLDQYLLIKSWYRYEELIEKVEILCFKRLNKKLKNISNNKIDFIDHFEYNISSTMIRGNIFNSNYKQLEGIINNNVLAYIIKNNLYVV